MKRVPAFLLSLLMAASLAACSQESAPQTESEGAPAESGLTASEASSATSPAVEAPEGFVLVEGGSFPMGSPDSEPWRSEDETQQTVTVSDFYIRP